jgi:hypothetical protein
MNKILIYSIILTILTQSLCSLTETYDYQNTSGYQVYYIKNDQYFSYATLTGSSSSIQIEMNLMVRDINNSNIQNGVWAGIGFGSDEMDNSDMVVFTYNGSQFNCADYWAPGNMIQTDGALGGNNDVTYVSGNIETLDSTYAPYSRLLTWTCTKNIATLDSYDWTDFANWQSNKGHTIGAIGPLNSQGAILQHLFNSEILNLADGENDPSAGYFHSINLALLVGFMLLF